MIYSVIFREMTCSNQGVLFTLAQMYKAMYGDAKLVPIWTGAKIAAENQQRYLSPNFATGVNSSLEELRNIKVRHFLIQKFFNIATPPPPKQVTFFKQLDSSLVRHVNAASRKSLLKWKQI